MAEKRTTYKIQDLGGIGEVHIADEVVAIVAGLAATDVDGVASMAGNITNELVSKLGKKNLSKGIHIAVEEESIRVDVHISLQSDISMPLAISALQKQIKKYLEACSGVMVQEVRVFVDSTIPADEKTEASPYAIPTALLGLDADPLPVGKPEKQDEPEPQTEEQQGAEAECGVEPEADEPETKADDTAEEAAQEDEQQTAEQEQGEQA